MYYNALHIILKTTILVYWTTFFEIITLTCLYVCYLKICKAYISKIIKTHFKKLYKYIRIIQKVASLKVFQCKQLLHNLINVKKRVLSKTIRISFEINTHSIKYYCSIIKEIENYIYDVFYEYIRFFLRTLRFERRILCLLFFYNNILLYKGFYTNYFFIDLTLAFSILGIIGTIYAIIVYYTYIHEIISKYILLYLYITYLALKCLIIIPIVILYTTYIFLSDVSRISFNTNDFLKDLLFKFLIIFMC